MLLRVCQWGQDFGCLARGSYSGWCRKPSPQPRKLCEQANVGAAIAVVHGIFFLVGRCENERQKYAQEHDQFSQICIIIYIRIPQKLQETLKVSGNIILGLLSSYVSWKLKYPTTRQSRHPSCHGPEDGTGALRMVSWRPLRPRMYLCHQNTLGGTSLCLANRGPQTRHWLIGLP